MADENSVYGIDDQINGPDTIFRYAQDGTSDVEVIHEFGDGPENGLRPNSDLSIIDSTLYGSAEQGGANEAGIFYSIDTNSPAINMPPTGGGGAVPEPSSGFVWGLLLVTSMTARWAKQRFK